MEKRVPIGGWIVSGQNVLFKIAKKQYLGCLMILEGDGGVQNVLLKIAAKQCLRLLMMLDFDTLF